MLPRSHGLYPPTPGFSQASSSAIQSILFYWPQGLSQEGEIHLSEAGEIQCRDRFRALHWDAEIQDAASLELLRSTIWKEPVGSKCSTEESRTEEDRGLQGRPPEDPMRTAAPVHAYRFYII